MPAMKFIATVAQAGIIIQRYADLLRKMNADGQAIANVEDVLVHVLNLHSWLVKIRDNALRIPEFLKKL